MNTEMDATIYLPKTKTLNGISWPERCSIKQYFSLTSNIIYYMAMNPSTPKVYNKLIQCCKYFFERNPIIVAENMTKVNTFGYNGDSESYCTIFKTTKVSTKIWLLHKLLLTNLTPSFIPQSLRPKIYQSQIKKLGIHDTKVNFNDFLFFASTVEILFLTSVEMTYNDEKNVMLEKIFEVVPNVKEVQYGFIFGKSVVTESTIKNISNLPNLEHLQKLTFLYVYQALNIEDLTLLSKKCEFLSVYYSGNQLSQEYKNQLNEIRKNKERFSNLYVNYDNWAFGLNRLYNSI
uniref:Uncharacterized protein n=1 Tax=Panagrolaimus sp. PS1159 TaxID=55785 RepID=A0AC35GRE7_9BILA